MNFDPGPSDGGPVSMFHEDGASTEVTGREVCSNAAITAGNGSRTSPEKENPIWLSVWAVSRTSHTGERTEDSVNDMVRLLERGGKVVGEWYGKILELC